MPIIEIRGKKQVRSFWFSDYGVNVVSNGIIAHEDVIKRRSRPMLRAFVPASEIKDSSTASQESR